jgi:cytoskeletal protein CcmA (bactofilin family)
MFKKNRPLQASNSTIDTLVGRTGCIKGDVLFSGGLHLDGRIVGNVRAQGGEGGEGTALLSVSEHGIIEGSVDVAHVVLNGSVRGDIMARERIELGAKARVNGNVYYGVIEMAMGAEINGKLIHQPANGATQTPVLPRVGEAVASE